MKRFNDYIEDVQIVEAFGPNRYYSGDLRSIFDEYEKTKDSKKGAAPEKLAKYPMAILVDKAGFKPSTIIKRIGPGWSSRTKEVNDDAAYGQFILDEMEKGTFTKDDLIKWWKEYDEEVGKKNWSDPKWVIKNLDVTRFWDPWRPKDTSAIDACIEEPARLIGYYVNNPKAGAKGSNLSSEEKKELQQYYSDPVNKEALSKAFKSIKKKLEAARPTFESAALKVIQDLLETSVTLDGKDYDLKRQLGKDDRYSDTRDEKADAIKSLCLNIIKDYYGLDYAVYSLGSSDYNGDQKAHINRHGEKDDAKLEKFVDDGGNGIKIHIKDLGTSKDNGETSGVHSSSFSTYYKHDFEVELCVFSRESKKSEQVLKKRYDSVTVAWSYFSGGWN